VLQLVNKADALPRLDTLIPGQHSRREILTVEAKSPSSASTVQVEVEGKKERHYLDRRRRAVS
jgi:hypothetical protein